MEHLFFERSTLIIQKDSKGDDDIRIKPNWEDPCIAAEGKITPWTSLAVAEKDGKILIQGMSLKNGSDVYEVFWALTLKDDTGVIPHIKPNEKKGAVLIKIEDGPSYLICFKKKSSAHHFWILLDPMEKENYCYETVMHFVNEMKSHDKSTGPVKSVQTPSSVPPLQTLAEAVPNPGPVASSSMDMITNVGNCELPSSTLANVQFSTSTASTPSSVPPLQTLAEAVPNPGPVASSSMDMITNDATGVMKLMTVTNDLEALSQSQYTRSPNTQLSVVLGTGSHSMVTAASKTNSQNESSVSKQPLHNKSKSNGSRKRSVDFSDDDKRVNEELKRRGFVEDRLWTLLQDFVNERDTTNSLREENAQLKIENEQLKVQIKALEKFQRECGDTLAKGNSK